MRAVVTRAFGGPDQLQLEERPAPRVTPGNAVIKVLYCGVNPLDVFSRQVQWGGMELPRVQGSEVVGRVLALPERDPVDLPPGVPWAAPGTLASVPPEPEHEENNALVGRDEVAGPSRVKEGDLVVVNPYLFCGNCSRCRAGQTNLCANHPGEIWGVATDGGYTGQALAPLRSLTPVPTSTGIDHKHYAVGIAALTAYHMIHDKLRLASGERVLVWGATGGVGSAAVQWAKLAGAQVYGVVGSTEKVQVARELGADEVLDYHAQDVRREVQELTRGRGVDAVVEHVGAATWDTSLACLRRGGRLATCGASTGHQVNLPLNRLFIKQWQLFGSTGGTNANVRAVVDLVTAGKFTLLIDEVRPLEDVGAVHERLARGDVTGKILLAP